MRASESPCIPSIEERRHRNERQTDFRCLTITHTHTHKQISCSLFSLSLFPFSASGMRTPQVRANPQRVVPIAMEGKGSERAIGQTCNSRCDDRRLSRFDCKNSVHLYDTHARHTLSADAFESLTQARDNTSDTKAAAAAGVKEESERRESRT